jgi:CHASE3 domain sensor protein
MVLAAALAFNQTKQMRQTSNLVTHRQEVLKKIEEVTTDMVDLASRERVFVITGIESFSTERQELKRKTAADLAEALAQKKFVDLTHGFSQAVLEEL